MSRRVRADQLALFPEPKCKRCGHPCVGPTCRVCIETLRSMSAFGEGEFWVDVPGHEGVHQVSSLGRVRSLDRMVTQRHGNGGSYRRRLKGQLLNPALSGGYPGVSMYGLRTHTTHVHVLVLGSFVGPCPDGMECRHLDDVKTNNRLFNLAWGTRTENGRDRVRNGIHPEASRTHCDKGHAYTPENTAIRIRDGRASRVCRQCQRDRHQEHRRRKEAS
jgi:HNH endonuclease/NUMOD4 motif